MTLPVASRKILQVLVCVFGFFVMLESPVTELHAPTNSTPPSLFLSMNAHYSLPSASLLRCLSRIQKQA